MVRWIGLVQMTPKTYDNHRQRDKHIIRLEREHTSLRTKLEISFNGGKFNAKALKYKSLFFVISVI